MQFASWKVAVIVVCASEKIFPLDLRVLLACLPIKTKKVVLIISDQWSGLTSQIVY